MTLDALSAVLVAQALCSKALSDKEEWVSMIGCALGRFDGRAHADAVAKGSAAVSSATPAYFWALEVLQSSPLFSIQNGFKSILLDYIIDSCLKHLHRSCLLRP